MHCAALGTVIDADCHIRHQRHTPSALSHEMELKGCDSGTRARMPRIETLKPMAHCRQDMYTEVPIPAALKEYKSFEFLRRDLRVQPPPGSRAGSVHGGSEAGSLHGASYALNSGGCAPPPPVFWPFFGFPHLLSWLLYVL